MDKDTCFISDVSSVNFKTPCGGVHRRFVTEGLTEQETEVTCETCKDYLNSEAFENEQ
jgi:hypothetical protein